jgi:hypothetical protein
MDIHKPKPWHDWRELAKEVGTIVIGVLIALGAEQAVEWLHWRHEVKVAFAEIRGEMAQSSQKLAFRVAAEPCIARRLDALESVIERVAKHEPAPHLASAITDPGNAYSESIWQNYRAAQTLTHFGDKEIQLLGAYYLQISSLRQLVSHESDAMSVLAEMKGDPARLGPADIANLRVALQHARFDNALIAGIAADELQTSKALRVPLAATDSARLADACAALPVTDEL